MRLHEAITFGCGALVALAHPLLPASILSAQTTPSTERRVDALMAPYAAPAGPGASVLVVRDGRVACERSYGLAEVESGTPVTPRTNFRLASLSKQFTATAVMLLVADGRLHYDDSLATFLPALPAYARRVTVRQLLNHTAGLPDYEDFVPDSQTAQVHDADIPALIARATAPRFAPGTQYAYSNTGYVLLALVVERVSGQRFADFLHQRIFAPLHMTGTVAFEDGRSVVPHRAYGYTFDSAGLVHRTDQSNTSATLGDGGIYTSAADLAKWDRALERHTLVSADAQRLAWTPPRLPEGRETQYGFGWFVTNDRGATRLIHHGESRGFTNAIVRYPERRLTVVVLTNRTGGAPWEIAQRIAELYLAPPLVGAPTVWRP
ncbi:MAG TPA: serine hydrolase domain-containing protein [Gemmatimonadaceae bacterium]|nr:serine hydrolase domain-containing protein [Gemmatimonadaceae bacterium]